MADGNPRHLYDAGWDPARETHKAFVADREIDEGIAEERALSVALKSIERDPARRIQIMRSALEPSQKRSDGRPSWSREKVQAGSKFYALTTVADDGRGFKSSASAYWLSEAQVTRFEQGGLIDIRNRKIEAADLKNRLAIPCSNRVNGLVEAQVTHEHEAIRTTVGHGKDIYSVGDEERTRWMEGGEEQWHPDLAALTLDRTTDRQKLAQRNGYVADTDRSISITRRPTDRTSMRAWTAPSHGSARETSSPSAGKGTSRSSPAPPAYAPAARPAQRRPACSCRAAR